MCPNTTVHTTEQILNRIKYLSTLPKDRLPFTKLTDLPLDEQVKITTAKRELEGDPEGLSSVRVVIHDFILMWNFGVFSVYTLDEEEVTIYAIKGITT